MRSLILSFLGSLLATLAILRFAHLHARFSGDHDTGGPQKFHARAVPRIGSLGILTGFACAAAALFLNAPDIAKSAFILLACAAPAFLVGFTEDLTKRVSPTVRLMVTLLAALLGCFWLGARITRFDIPGFGSLAIWLPVSLTLTTLAVAGLAHAFNIIDGFNGLAAMVAIMMLASLGYVGFKVHDPLITTLALAAIGATLGFFVWNFPAGLIFLGDGGAYLIGFLLAELALLLLRRHAEVSAWYPVLLFIYPVFETCFSIYRRYWVRGLSPSLPDGVHLHTLIYKRLLRWAIGGQNAQALIRRNSLTSPYLWLLSAVAVIPATLFYHQGWMLLLFTSLFGCVYVWLYACIVYFKTPEWLIRLRTLWHE